MNSAVLHLPEPSDDLDADARDAATTDEPAAAEVQAPPPAHVGPVGHAAPVPDSGRTDTDRPHTDHPDTDRPDTDRPDRPGDGDPSHDLVIELPDSPTVGGDRTRREPPPRPRRTDPEPARSRWETPAAQETAA